MFNYVFFLQLFYGADNGKLHLSFLFIYLFLCHREIIKNLRMCLLFWQQTQKWCIEMQSQIIGQ